MQVLFIVALMFAAFSVEANPPVLVDRQTGKYLGNLNANKYDQNSVNNPYGRYGSKYSPDSINNRYGNYGSAYSPNSANNQYATNPPAIYHAPNQYIIAPIRY